ncbi:alpha-(1,3)-fucosyltransferase C-like [Paramacrobiotus metropolitanus]|uniref:alpha-(1,3)-fucosyltransferase C-like n=1 Tax=Paramacrobiotus metropolitanus TaxID=2943436 RepID=UPI0024457F8B|nr:alpha-(1,3)-fucosyltransferase C-like [Paramacrobiotus metropolitanus]XP_055334690.1 alpha-(1,3)-fucosyltransferase C-like [Paramacrobiotus metropolitanus]
MAEMLLAKISRISPAIFGGCLAAYMIFAVLTFRSDRHAGNGSGKSNELPVENKLTTPGSSANGNAGTLDDIGHPSTAGTPAVNTEVDLMTEEYPKIILFWTKFFGGPNSFMGEEGLKLKDCPINNCVLSDDREDVNISDALIFHPIDFDNLDLPVSRQPHQYYIYFVLESPHHASAVGPPGFFNLTFTYRFDSDIIADNYLQYFRPVLWTRPGEFDDLWAIKRKVSAIFMSNCGAPSQREKYIAMLKEHMPVDVYGACGDIQCPRSTQKDCDALIKQYKFYFAFENSICKDYISEKIIRAFDAGAVPVVMGGANYSTIFPPNSVIDALNFGSPKILAEYLMHLAQNKNAYLRHFKWRFQPEQMKLAPFLSPETVSLCKLCALLHAEPRIQKSYADLQLWWEKEAKCVTPDWMATFGASSPPPSAQLAPGSVISGFVPYTQPLLFV